MTEQEYADKYKKLSAAFLNAAFIKEYVSESVHDPNAVGIACKAARDNLRHLMRDPNLPSSVARSVISAVNLLDLLHNPAWDAWVISDPTLVESGRIIYEKLKNVKPLAGEEKEFVEKKLHLI